MKQFCPNCEKDTDCTHEAELYACNECGEDFAKYIVSRKPANSDVSIAQNVLIDIKTGNSVNNNHAEETAEISTIVQNYFDEVLDDLIRDARDYESSLNIGRGISGAANACNISRSHIKMIFIQDQLEIKRLKTELESKLIIIKNQQGRLNEMAQRILKENSL